MDSMNSIVTPLSNSEASAIAGHTGKICKNFPWYLDLIPKGKVLLRIYDLPFLTSDLLIDKYYTAEQAFNGMTHEYFTSGTTSGLRKRIVFSEREHKTYISDRTQIIEDFVKDKDYRAFADLGTGHAAASAEEIFTNIGLENSSIDFSCPIDEHVAALNAFQPDLLFTMPMILNQLINHGDLAIDLKQVILLGDVVTDAWARSARAALNLDRSDLIDLMGSIEIGSIAHYDADLDCYLINDRIFPEAVAPSAIYDRSERQHDSSILVLTAFGRDHFPALRYVTDDLVTGFGTIQDRSGHARYKFDRCLGRYSDEYKHGERLSLYEITEAIEAYLPHANFDLKDTQFGLSIRISCSTCEVDKFDLIKRRLLEYNPSVRQMIDSGLVSDIDIQQSRSVTHGAKRRY